MRGDTTLVKVQVSLAILLSYCYDVGDTTVLVVGIGWNWLVVLVNER